MKNTNRSGISVTTLTVGAMAVNCYIVADSVTADALIIDPGDESEYIAEKILSLNVRPIAVVATHGHFDHVMAAFAVQKTFGIPFFIHGADAFLLSRMHESARHFLGITSVDPPPVVDRMLHDGEILRAGKLLLKVIETPGHTPGSVCLYHAGSASLFCGDLLFAHGDVGRTDFSYSDAAALRGSIDRVLGYPQATALYAGHGSSTTIGSERPHHKRSPVHSHR